MKPEGIADTCFCIDLWQGQLLGLLSDFNVRMVIPDIVTGELRTPKIRPFIEAGAETRSAEPEEVQLVEELSQRYRKTSVADLFALAMAMRRNVLLLTNDKHLRMAATQENVKVKGILWLLDSLEDQVSGDYLASALERILAGGARLPPDQCKARLARWRPRT
jgi:predicted nucleic acid-binding protein